MGIQRLYVYKTRKLIIDYLITMAFMLSNLSDVFFRLIWITLLRSCFVSYNCHIFPREIGLIYNIVSQKGQSFGVFGVTQSKYLQNPSWWTLVNISMFGCRTSSLAINSSIWNKKNFFLIQCFPSQHCLTIPTAEIVAMTLFVSCFSCPQIC